MPRRATHALRWNPEVEAYEVQRGGAPGSPDVVADGPAWRAWLAGVMSFAFQGRSGGACTVREEAARRGGAYWYAYRRAGGRMRKRYLGRGADLTLARLEAAALALSATAPAASSPRGSAARPNGGAGVGIEAGIEVGGEAPYPLLTTKLHAPGSSARLVSRPHVLSRLQRGLERPLTLVAAPAGFGKTTSLRAWIQRGELPVAWVSLDAGDDDPTQFWTYALTALNAAYPGVADTALAALHATPLAAVPRALVNAVAASPRDVVLVLDDYHLITASAIHQTVAALLEHPPAQLHLYLAARGEPPLPLARLRAYDQVNEVRADDLRFRPDEVAAFLDEVMGVRLAAEDVMSLAERTDGWIAGLQLAGLSLQGHPDPSAFVATFGGSHRHVLRYLGEEVLAAQSAEVQSFLLQTALLERLCGPLCDALTGRDDGHALLARLERANLFLVPLDDEGRWYRYYHLFADLLRHRLRQEAAGSIPALHRRAARWLEDEGWIVEAAEHLFAAPDLEEAARVIARASGAPRSGGDAATVPRLLERLRARQPTGGPLGGPLGEPLVEPLDEPLSAREREVLGLLAEGRSNAEIARHLVVAVSTVKTHVHHIFVKLDAADRLQAVTRARALGLLER